MPKPIDDGHLDSYLDCMTEYSIAEAKNQFPRLIDRMLDGDLVTITRRGKPVAQIVPIDPQSETRPTPIDGVWLRSIREAASTGVEPTVDTVKAMRDDYRY